MTVVFGTGANGQRCLVSGWSNPEPGFTWSNSNRAVIRLVRPDGVGAWRLRLVLRPFVRQPDLPAQRLSLRVNEREVGHVVLRDYTVLECVLPWEVLVEHTDVIVQLDLPDATRPSEGARMLGVMLLSLALTPVTATAALPREPELVVADSRFP